MLKINPLQKIKTPVITVPGSKYIANRVLMLAALAKGTSVISNVPENNDINHAIEALVNFGIDIEKQGNQLTIHGSEGSLFPQSERIDVGESGTLMRFITAMAALSKKKVTITGSDRICQRPVEHLIDALGQVNIWSDSKTGCPPVSIKGGTISGGEIKVKGNISSQFISGLLLVSPFAKKDLTIKLTTELVSEKYVDMTIKLMATFGVHIERKGYQEFFIAAGQHYTAQNFKMPGDWSSASYFLAAAAVLKDKITIENMDLNSIQGEAKFYEVLEKMGCNISFGKDSITLLATQQLSGIDIDMGNMPDVAQTLAAIAPFVSGKTVIRNIEHLRYKECDRIQETVAEMKKLGANIRATKDSIILEPSTLSGAILETHNDHRVAMSLALVGLKVDNCRLLNPEVAAKSFPGYWEKLREIGVRLEEM